MKINGQTRVFGIIGSPVGHSRSPAMHNAAFARIGMNAVYVPFEVDRTRIGEALRSVRALSLAGVNVTIPHKESVIEHLDGLSREARLIGAVNTVMSKKGRLTGYNTDAYGFIRSLKEDLRFTPRGRNIFMIGAGGAAKAVAFALAIAGARRIVITDAIDDKALELACDVELKTGCEAVALPIGAEGMRDMALNAHLLVNATPLGMKASDPSPVDPGFLHRGLRVFDLVYNRETELIAFCRKKKIRCAGGLNMLLYQGVRSFEIWTGKKAPITAMKKALENS